MMYVSDIIKRAIEDSPYQQKEVAAYMGWTPQNFQNRLRNNTIDADEWVQIANYLGYEVKMVNQSGEDIAKRQAVGQATRQMVGGTIYDTKTAKAICHSSKFVGTFFELYKTEAGEYFVVMYSKWLDKGQIIPVSQAHAEEFMADCM